MDEKELDEQPLEPFVPIGRFIGGPIRTGYVPYKLFVIMQLMNLVFQPPAEPYVNLDMFAGQCAISRAFQARGYRTCSLDIAIDERDDICEPLGFIRHLYAAMNIAPGGLAFIGVVCSSWVALNRGTSGRSRDNPCGREQFPSVQKANLMLSRVVLLLTVIMHHRGHWVIQNPISSLIDYYPRLEEFLRYRAHFKVTTWLGMFGATTPKAVKLFSDDGFVQHLVRKLDRSKFAPSNTTIRYRDGAGKMRYKGSSTLKARQTYPRNFGRHVALAWDTYAVRNPEYLQLIDWDPDHWADAKLDSVEEWLTQYLRHRSIEIWEPHCWR